jgi:hypothetical protein
MVVKTVKGIDEENWIRFKTFAAKKNVTMALLFRMMLENYARNEDFLWNKILSAEKIISAKEADALNAAVNDLRKEKGFRA